MLPASDGQDCVEDGGSQIIHLRQARYRETTFCYPKATLPRPPASTCAATIAHLDVTWVYPGNGDYNSLLVEKDITEALFARGAKLLRGCHARVIPWRNPRCQGPQCGTPFLRVPGTLQPSPA